MKCDIKEPIKLVRGDSYPKIIITLLDEEDEPMNIQEWNPKLYIREAGEEIFIFSLYGSLLSGIEQDNIVKYYGPYQKPGAGGRILFSWHSGDLDLSEGIYQGEIELQQKTDNTIRWTVYEPLKFILRNDFGD